MFPFKEPKRFKDELEIPPLGDTLATEGPLFDDDFELFKALGFKFFYPDFLTSISVEPPTCWKQISTVFAIFQVKTSKKFLLWLVDPLNEALVNDSVWTIFPWLDFFLSMDEGSNLKFVLKSYFYLRLRFDNTLYPDSVIQKLSDCMSFTPDSLTLNFFQNFDFFKDMESVSILQRVLNHFSSFELKKLSVLYFQSKKYEDFQLIVKIIDSNRNSLVDLILIHVNYPKQSNESFLGKKIHLPNIERIIIQNCAFKFEENFTTGTKLKWIDLNLSWTLPTMNASEEVVLFHKGISTNNSREFLNFLNAHADLECFSGFDTVKFQSLPPILSAFKAMKSLKRLNCCINVPLEDFIGSTVLEHLSIGLYNRLNPNWNFIKSLERLNHLEITSSFTPDDEFWDFLRLDRLDSLSIPLCELDPQSNDLFFKVLGQLKNLRVLMVANNHTKNPILSQSIEILTIYILCKEKNQKLISEFLPFGSRVKHLSILTSGCDQRSIELDLAKFYPRLLSLRSFPCIFNRSSKYKVSTFDRPLCEGIPLYY